METCSTELSDLLSDVSKDELRGLLLVLEGRVVSTGKRDMTDVIFESPLVDGVHTKMHRCIYPV